MRVIVGDEQPFIYRDDERCNVPDPEQPTLLCGRAIGHGDNHADVGMSGLVHAVWEPYTESDSPLPDGVKDVLGKVYRLVEDISCELASAESDLWRMKRDHKDNELISELLRMVRLPSDYEVEGLGDPHDDASAFQVVKDARERLAKRRRVAA